MTISTAQAPHHPFYEKHRALLERAVAAAKARDYWSAYSESPSPRFYGESARTDGEAAFQALLNKDFDLPGHPNDDGRRGEEASPYGLTLGVSYPAAKPDTLIAAARAAGVAGGEASPETRAGILLECLARLNAVSFLIANAVMHTSGQAFAMAFQAGGPHAQDRALEAVAYAFDAMSEVPTSVVWTKPVGKDQSISLDKSFRILPRGLALAIGCATFPTWNSYPGIFASLATGNSVIVKPHPQGVLPLAVSIRICREVLSEAGFDPNVLLLAADSAEAPVAKTYALHPAIDMIDFTGGPAFGRWLRENAAGKQLYTEEAGLNAIVIDSTDDFRAMCGNIAFSLSLYSGQMCTTPQNIFIPAGGIASNDGHKSFDEVAAGIAGAIDKLLADPERAAGVLGAIQNEASLQRLASAARLGRIVRASESLPVPGAPHARTASPLLVAVTSADRSAYLEERFGPIAFLIAAADTDEAIAIASGAAKAHGAITAAIYSTDEDIIARAFDAFAGAGVALSVNLTGGIFVNQSAAFSDFHVSGANPSGTASLTDKAFVANRFRVATIRRLKAA